MKKLASLVIALAMAFAVTATAEAKEVTTAPPAMTSLPYVEDVNPWSNGSYIATVVCYGGGAPFELKVTDGKKRVKARRLGTGQWSVVLRPNRTYRIAVRAKGTAWKAIRYGIC